MNQYIRKSQAIAYIIGIIAILLIIFVWPFGWIHRVHNESSLSTDIVESEKASEERMMAQVFVSEGNKLDWIDIYIYSGIPGEKLDFAIYDGEYNRIYHKEITLGEEFDNPGYLRILTRLKLDKGMPYIYTVYGMDTGVTIGLENHYLTANKALMTANYAGGEDVEHNVATRMKFSILFTPIQVIILYITIILVAGVTLFFVLLIYGRVRNKRLRFLSGRLADKSIKFQPLVQIILNPIIICLTAISLYCVFPKCLFSDKLYNIVFSYVSILMFAGILLYIVNHKRSEAFEGTKTCEAEWNLRSVTGLTYSKIQRYLIELGIAEVLWNCFEYMNGLYDIDHSYSARRILIWLLITIIFTFDNKEILIVFNAIWMIIGIPVCYIYAKPYLGVEESELIYRLNAVIIYAGGFIVINYLKYIVKTVLVKRKKTDDGDSYNDQEHISSRINIIFFVALLVFIIGITILANTRWWPRYMLAIFVILGMRLFIWRDRDRWLEYLCNGILLNFMAMVIFSLLHRPFYGYIYHRYNMTYFTVTMTATHLTLCMAAAIVRLLIRYRTVKDIKRLIPDMMLFGAVSNYMIFTLSRTGYLSVFVMIIVELAVYAYIYVCKEQRIKESLKMLGMITVATLYMFPIVFTLTRTIPSLVDDPVIYDYEHCEITMYKGTDPDNEYYMDIHRFFQVFGSKILNVGDAVTGINVNIPITEYRQDDKPLLLASADSYKAVIMAADMIEDIDDSEEDTDESNGRIDIFKSYIDQINLWGHDRMGAILDDGTEASHAHNIYLQVMYDHGLIYGVYFVLFMIFALVYGVLRLKKGKVSDYDILVPVLLIGFMTAGMTEWIFHPCNPYGMAVIMTFLAMMFNRRDI